jgi:para-aminobenzoate synthetase/4-amino-4-deoxychorismate lyase
VTFYADAESEWRELAAKSRLLQRAAGGFELLETLRLEGGEYWLLSRHLQRLEGSARYFSFPFSAAAAQGQLQALAREHNEGLYRVRLTLARDGRSQAQAYPLTPTPQPVFVALGTQPLDTLGGTHEFVLNKTTRRDHYDSRLLPDPALFDTLLVNERGQLTEFTRGNLAIKKAGRWLTPASHCGLLPGTYRQALLETGRIAEAVLTVDDLAQAEEIAFFNSLRGWLLARLAR